MGRTIASLLLVVSTACGGSQVACPGLCDSPGPAAATLAFQCSLDVAPIVESSGPCTAQVNARGQGGGYWSVSVEPTSAGACQVSITLADGYRSTSEVTFVASYVEGDSCCRSGTAISPTVSQIAIDNPDDACTVPLAGPDASLIGGDGAVRGEDAAME
jgi:hypothetical protein